MNLSRTLAAGLALAVAQSLCAAQAFPARAVTWVVPYPAGGPADVIARTIAPRVARELAQPVVIENLPGAGGALAAMKVLNAPADGHTVFQGSPNEVILAPLANAAVKIRLDDLALITPFTVNPLILLVRKDYPAATVDEFLAVARAASHPPSYGSVGPGSMFHLAAEDLGGRIGAKLMHVPYKGGAPLLQDLGGGSIDFALLPFTVSYASLAQSGRLKILAVAAPQRLAGLKDVPTFGESQVMRGFQHGAWAGLMVKHGTPKPVLDRLHAAIAAALADPQVQDALTATGSQVHRTLSLDESHKFLQAEARRYVELAQRVGVKPQ